MTAKMKGDDSIFNSYVDNNYDSSADYWKLTKDGSLAYDGKASLLDENGNIIKSWKKMGLSSDDAVEGGLINILGIDPKNKNDVAAVRKLMEDSGLKHTFEDDPDKWLWTVAHTNTITDTNSGFSFIDTRNLTNINMDTPINLGAITAMYDTLGVSADTISGFINGTYGSAIDFLNYTANNDITIGNTLLSKVYDQSDMNKIQTNRTWYNNVMANNLTLNNMIDGTVKRTSEFGVLYDNIKLASSSVPGASYFWEWHTGVDYGSGGKAVNTPGGYWQVLKGDDNYPHRGYFQLFGSDLKMRIMHIKPSEVSAKDVGSIIGNGNDSTKIYDYPTESYGSGSGAHVHIDFTKRLPYNGRYERQFINPETFRPGSRFEYPFGYQDSSKTNMPKYPANFYRY
jgi:hypothetical protein